MLFKGPLAVGIQFLYQAPFCLNDKHLIITFKAEHCDAPSVYCLSVVILFQNLIVYPPSDQHRQLGLQTLLQMLHRPSGSLKCPCHSQVLILQNCMFFQTFHPNLQIFLHGLIFPKRLNLEKLFYPNLQIFLHGLIPKIPDILQLCFWFSQVPLSQPGLVNFHKFLQKTSNPLLN